jgi:ABC-type multidrug transport system ATPase subunit
VGFDSKEETALGLVLGLRFELSEVNDKPIRELSGGVVRKLTIALSSWGRAMIIRFEGRPPH